MRLTIREIAVFGMLAAVMYASKIIMELLPNIHLLGVFVIAMTLVYRKKALYPLYTFVLLTGLFSGFATWWYPYLYIWTVLWGAAMLLPKKLSPKVQPVVCMLLCAAHGRKLSVFHRKGFAYCAVPREYAAAIIYLLHGFTILSCSSSVL